MKAAPDPVGPDSDRALACATDTVVAGWVTNAHPARISHVLKVQPKLHALGVTMGRHPRHPLYVRLSPPGVSGDMIPWKDRLHGTSQQVPARAS
jgi:hypothetical protein